MNLTVKTEGASLSRQMATLGSDIQDAANQAVERQTAETLGRMRGHIAQRLSTRAANALRSHKYVNTASALSPVGSVAGYIHSGWWRKPRGGGEDIDMFAAFERGDVVRPQRGQFLAIPLPQAYAVAGRGKKAPTPRLVEAALDTKLFVLKRSGKPALLCARGVATGGGGKRAVIRAGQFRNRKGGISKRRTSGAVIPMFVLLRNTRLPRRLSFEPIRAEAEQRLAEKVIVALGAKGAFD